MSWKNAIKKEKYQGPPQEHAEHGEAITTHSIRSALKTLNFYIERLGKEINKDPQKTSSNLNHYYNKLQSTIDEMDKKMIAQAKYGVGDDRKDAKYMANYGAKYRPERNVKDDEEDE